MKIEDFIELLYEDPNDFYSLFNNLFYEVENDNSLEYIQKLIIW